MKKYISEINKKMRERKFLVVIEKKLAKIHTQLWPTHQAILADINSFHWEILQESHKKFPKALKD